MKNTKKPESKTGRKPLKAGVAKQTLKDLDAKKPVKGGAFTTWDCGYNESECG